MRHNDAVISISVTTCWFGKLFIIRFWLTGYDESLWRLLGENILWRNLRNPHRIQKIFILISQNQSHSTNPINFVNIAHLSPTISNPSMLYPINNNISKWLSREHLCLIERMLLTFCYCIVWVFDKNPFCILKAFAFIDSYTKCIFAVNLTEKYCNWIVNRSEFLADLSGGNCIEGWLWWNE